jgi:hypothetical protein
LEVCDIHESLVLEGVEKVKGNACDFVGVMPQYGVEEIPARLSALIIIYHINRKLLTKRRHKVRRSLRIRSSKKLRSHLVNSGQHVVEVVAVDLRDLGEDCGLRLCDPHPFGEKAYVWRVVDAVSEDLQNVTSRVFL